MRVRVYTTAVMKLTELKAVLRANPNAPVRVALPDGDEIPAHFHVTEVGDVAKRFIDCGGMLHQTSHTCLLQTHVGDDVEHRLTAGRFGKILELGARVLPHDDIEVEVEYDCCVTAQYPVLSARAGSGGIEVQLGEKRTACLAKSRAEASKEPGCCGSGSETAEVAGCCG